MNASKREQEGFKGKTVGLGRTPADETYFLGSVNLH